MSEKMITTRQVNEAIMGVRGNSGALKGRKIAGYFFRSRIMARFDHSNTKRYPAEVMKLRKSTTPINVISEDTTPIKITAMNGTR